MRLQILSQTIQVLQRVTALVADAREFGRDTLALIQLEAKLAVSSLVSIGILSFLAALLVFTGWILLVASLVAWLSEDMLSLPASLLIVGLIAIICAIPLGLMIKGYAGNLDFKATRRQLGGRHEHKQP